MSVHSDCKSVIWIRTVACDADVHLVSVILHLGAGKFAVDTGLRVHVRVGRQII